MSRHSSWPLNYRSWSQGYGLRDFPVAKLIWPLLVDVSKANCVGDILRALDKTSSNRRNRRPSRSFRKAPSLRGAPRPVATTSVWRVTAAVSSVVGVEGRHERLHGATGFPITKLCHYDMRARSSARPASLRTAHSREHGRGGGLGRRESIKICLAHVGPPSRCWLGLYVAGI
jgi:hypothetical protein